MVCRFFFSLNFSTGFPLIGWKAPPPFHFTTLSFSVWPSSTPLVLPVFFRETLILRFSHTSIRCPSPDFGFVQFRLPLENLGLFLGCTPRPAFFFWEFSPIFQLRLPPLPVPIVVVSLFLVRCALASLDVPHFPATSVRTLHTPHPHFPNPTV